LGNNKEWEMPKRRKSGDKICGNCRQRKAISYINGKFKYASDHPLCMRCYQAEVDRNRKIEEIPDQDEVQG